MNRLVEEWELILNICLLFATYSHRLFWSHSPLSRDGGLSCSYEYLLHFSFFSAFSCNPSAYMSFTSCSYSSCSCSSCHFRHVVLPFFPNSREVAGLPGREGHRPPRVKSHPPCTSFHWSDGLSPNLFLAWGSRDSEIEGGKKKEKYW